MEPYLLHGIKWNNFDLLVKILESGYILPRKDIEKGLVTDRNNLFNGNTHISLCQKSLYKSWMEDTYQCSFDSFIFNSPCLVLKKDNINLIYPRRITILDKNTMSPEEWRSLLFRDDGERVTYFADELQTKDKISLHTNLIAVGLPKAVLSYNKDGEETLSKVEKTLRENGLSVPIIDSSVYSFCDNAETIEKNKIKSLK